MRRISYKRVINNSSAVADEITMRAKKQNKIYTLAFTVLGIAVIAYILYSLSVTTYDGFVVSRNVNIRANYNNVVVDYMVRPGDYVKEGDTLYSYVNVDWVNNASNPYNVLNTDVRAWDAQLRRDRLRSEYTQQKHITDSLRGMVFNASEDVKLGVTTKEFLTDKKLELHQSNKKQEHILRLISIENKALADAENASKSAISEGFKDLGSYTHSQRINNPNLFGVSYKYRVAYVDMLIVDIQARNGVLVMEGEPILTYMPYNTPSMLDMHAKMILTPEEYSEVHEDDIYRAYAGGEYIGSVRATSSSTYVNDGISQSASEYTYHYNDKHIIVRAEFISNTGFISRYQVDRLPIELRKYQLGFVNKMVDKYWEDRRAKEIERGEVSICEIN